MVEYGHTSRRLIRLLAVLTGFVLLLSTAVGYEAVRAQQLAEQATSIRAQQRAGCLAGNDARKGQLLLWHHVLDLPPTAPRTAAAQEQADEFGHYVDQVLAPRKCG